jgi:hypothetical protein
VTPLTRREFFTSTASGLGLAAVTALLQEEQARGEPVDINPLRPRPAHFAAQADRCIFIFLLGGVSHIDLLDPKPALARLDGRPIPDSFRSGIRLGQTNYAQPVMRSPFRFRRYGRCGMEMSEMLPQLGSVADDIALIRSMHHQAFDHAPGELFTMAGRDIPGRPSIGAWLTYGLGSAAQNLPGYVVLVNGRGPKARELLWSNGILPATYQGVLFRSGDSPILNLANPPGLAPGLHRAQLDAIGRLDRLQHERTGDPALAARIAAYELAFRMQTAAPELVDLRGETRATLSSYGESGFARSLLLARRLVERGVRFVTVTHHEWDTHGNLLGELPRACRDIDQPIAALIRDLKGRGLLPSTLVVGATEFGRTAITQGNQMPGRDHHPHGYSMFLAGGGVRGGQVIGATDELGWRVTEEPVHLNDFHATLLHLFGLDHHRLTYRHQGLDVRLTDVGGNIVTKLIS